MIRRLQRGSQVAKMFIASVAVLFTLFLAIGADRASWSDVRWSPATATTRKLDDGAVAGHSLHHSSRIERLYREQQAQSTLAVGPTAPPYAYFRSVPGPGQQYTQPLPLRRHWGPEEEEEEATVPSSTDKHNASSYRNIFDYFKQVILVIIVNPTRIDAIPLSRTLFSPIFQHVVYVRGLPPTAMTTAAKTSNKAGTLSSSQPPAKDADVLSAAADDVVNNITVDSERGRAHNHSAMVIGNNSTTTTSDMEDSDAPFFLFDEMGEINRTDEDTHPSVDPFLFAEPLRWTEHRFQVVAEYDISHTASDSASGKGIPRTRIKTSWFYISSGGAKDTSPTKSSRCASDTLTSAFAMLTPPLYAPLAEQRASSGWWPSPQLGRQHAVRHANATAVDLNHSRVSGSPSHSPPTCVDTATFWSHSVLLLDDPSLGQRPHTEGSPDALSPNRALLRAVAQHAGTAAAVRQYLAAPGPLQDTFADIIGVERRLAAQHPRGGGGGTEGSAAPEQPEQRHPEPPLWAMLDAASDIVKKHSKQRKAAPASSLEGASTSREGTVMAATALSLAAIVTDLVAGDVGAEGVGLRTLAGPYVVDAPLHPSSHPPVPLKEEGLSTNSYNTSILVGAGRLSRLWLHYERVTLDEPVLRLPGPGQGDADGAAAAGAIGGPALSRGRAAGHAAFGVVQNIATVEVMLRQMAVEAAALSLGPVDRPLSPSAVSAHAPWLRRPSRHQPLSGAWWTTHPSWAPAGPSSKTASMPSTQGQPPSPPPPHIAGVLTAADDILLAPWDMVLRQLPQSVPWMPQPTIAAVPVQMPRGDVAPADTSAPKRGEAVPRRQDDPRKEAEATLLAPLYRYWRRQWDARGGEAAAQFEALRARSALPSAEEGQKSRLNETAAEDVPTAKDGSLATGLLPNPRVARSWSHNGYPATERPSLVCRPTSILSHLLPQYRHDDTVNASSSFSSARDRSVPSGGEDITSALLDVIDRKALKMLQAHLRQVAASRAHLCAWLAASAEHTMSSTGVVPPLLSRLLSPSWWLSTLRCVFTMFNTNEQSVSLQPGGKNCTAESAEWKRFQQHILQGDSASKASKGFQSMLQRGQTTDANTDSSVTAEQFRVALRLTEHFSFIAPNRTHFMDERGRGLLASAAMSLVQAMRVAAVAAMTHDETVLRHFRLPSSWSSFLRPATSSSFNMENGKGDDGAAMACFDEHDAMPQKRLAQQLASILRHVSNTTTSDGTKQMDASSVDLARKIQHSLQEHRQHLRNLYDAQQKHVLLKRKTAAGIVTEFSPQEFADGSLAVQRLFFDSTLSEKSSDSHQNGGHTTNTTRPTTNASAPTVQREASGSRSEDDDSARAAAQKIPLIAGNRPGDVDGGDLADTDTITCLLKALSYSSSSDKKRSQKERKQTPTEVTGDSLHQHSTVPLLSPLEVLSGLQLLTQNLAFVARWRRKHNHCPPRPVLRRRLQLSVRDEGSRSSSTRRAAALEGLLLAVAGEMAVSPSSTSAMMTLPPIRRRDILRAALETPLQVMAEGINLPPPAMQDQDAHKKEKHAESGATLPLATPLAENDLFLSNVQMYDFAQCPDNSLQALVSQRVSTEKSPSATSQRARPLPVTFLFAGFSDVFYVPWRLFGGYSLLVDAFANPRSKSYIHAHEPHKPVIHEVSTPTALRWLQAASNNREDLQKEKEASLLSVESSSNKGGPLSQVRGTSALLPCQPLHHASNTPRTFERLAIAVDFSPRWTAQMCKRSKPFFICPQTSPAHIPSTFVGNGGVDVEGFFAASLASAQIENTLLLSQPLRAALSSTPLGGSAALVDALLLGPSYPEHPPTVTGSHRCRIDHVYLWHLFGSIIAGDTGTAGPRSSHDADNSRASGGTTANPLRRHYAQGRLQACAQGPVQPYFDAVLRINQSSSASSSSNKDELPLLWLGHTGGDAASAGAAVYSSLAAATASGFGGADEEVDEAFVLGGSVVNHGAVDSADDQLHAHKARYQKQYPAPAPQEHSHDVFSESAGPLQAVSWRSIGDAVRSGKSSKRKK